VFLSGAMVLLSVGVAMGQGTNPNVTGGGSSGTTTAGTVTTPGPVDAHGQMQAMTETEADADATLQPVRERAKKASAKTCAIVQRELAEIAKRIDDSANSAKGTATATGRIATEFGMTADAITAEQDQFEAGLGELTIAHTLKANSKTAISMDQLFQLRQEGLGWAQIAHGLNLRMSEVTPAMRSEGNVAAGVSKADGKVAMIHSNANVTTSTSAGIHAGPATVGTASSVGVGAGVKVGN
jgi:hypothetical protein